MKKLLSALLAAACLALPASAAGAEPDCAAPSAVRRAVLPARVALARLLRPPLRPPLPLRHPIRRLPPEKPDASSHRLRPDLLRGEALMSASPLCLPSIARKEQLTAPPQGALIYIRKKVAFLKLFCRLELGSAFSEAKGQRNNQPRKQQ